MEDLGLDQHVHFQTGEMRREDDGEIADGRMKFLEFLHTQF